MDDGNDPTEEGEFLVNWRLLLLILLSGLITKVLHGFSDGLCQWMAMKISPLPAEVTQLRGELRDMWEELRGISSMDNFADHAKLQRRINQREAELSTVERNHKSSSRKQRAVLYGVTFLLIEATRVGIVLFNRSIPVVRLPPETLWPLATVMSFPTGITGAIGSPVWALVCRQTVETLWTLYGS